MFCSVFFCELQLYPHFPFLFIIHRILHNIQRDLAQGSIDEPLKMLSSLSRRRRKRRSVWTSCLVLSFSMMTFIRNIHSKPVLMNVAVYFRSAVWKRQKLGGGAVAVHAVSQRFCCVRFASALRRVKEFPSHTSG